MKYYDFHCLIAEYECLLDAAETSLRRLDENVALFEEESALFRLELEALIGAERLNGWLTDAAPTPSPLRYPASSWRVNEGATTSSRTGECCWRRVVA